MDNYEYEQALYEKDQMLEKATQVIEFLRKDFQKVLNQYEECKQEKEEIIMQSESWNQKNEFDTLKRLLTQEIITFHPENIKSSYQAYNFKNELKLQIQREEELKDILFKYSENTFLFVELFKKCLDEPLQQGIEQLIIDFEKIEKNIDNQQIIQSNISDYQLETNAILIENFKFIKQLFINENIEQDYLIQMNKQIYEQQQCNNYITSIFPIIDQFKNIIHKLKSQNVQLLTCVEELNDKVQNQQNQNMNQLQEIQQMKNINQKQKNELENTKKKNKELLQMISEYEELLQQSIQIEEYNKLAQLFEQSLSDLEQLQIKYEASQELLEQQKFDKQKYINLSKALDQIYEDFEKSYNYQNIHPTFKKLNQLNKNYNSFYKIIQNMGLTIVKLSDQSENECLESINLAYKQKNYKMLTQISLNLLKRDKQFCFCISEIINEILEKISCDKDKGAETSCLSRLEQFQSYTNLY